MPESKPFRRVLAGLVLVFFVIAWFGNIEYRKLIKPDEGRYAEIAREMAVSGDWLTPRLNAIKYFEKPPLQAWATALAYSAFGVHHWTARLWTALTGLLGVFAIWFTGRRLFGEPAGLYGAMVAASSLLYVALGHISTLDMGLTFFMGCSLCGFLLAQQADTSQKSRRFWMALSWAATAAAMLSKGLVALIVPGMAIFVYAAIQRDWKIWLRIEPLLGMLILALIAVPWFVLVSLANPEFPGFFFIHEHFARFLTTEHRRDEPIWYFLPILLFGLLPWTLTAMAALRPAWQARSPGFASTRFLVIWFVVIFVFFSLSGSKLQAYILPMFPAAALFMGPYLAQTASRAFAWQLAPVALGGLALSAVVPFLDFARPDDMPAELYDSFSTWVQGAAFVLGGCSVAAMVLALRQHRIAAVVTTAVGGLLFTQLLLTGHDRLNPLSSAHGLVQKMKPMLTPDVPFYNIWTYEQTLPFYLGRPVTLVEFRDELDFGLRQQPELAISTFAEFEKLWASHPTAFALTSWDGLRQLEARQFPMRIVASDPRRVVVSKP
jgi:4-amino-4-deoxy-L-arabinose transferase-like glycosyltransferase